MPVGWQQWSLVAFGLISLLGASTEIWVRQVASRAQLSPPTQAPHRMIVFWDQAHGDWTERVISGFGDALCDLGYSLVESQVDRPEEGVVLPECRCEGPECQRLELGASTSFVAMADGGAAMVVGPAAMASYRQFLSETKERPGLLLTVAHPSSPRAPAGDPGLGVETAIGVSARVLYPDSGHPSEDPLRALDADLAPIRVHVIGRPPPLTSAASENLEALCAGGDCGPSIEEELEKLGSSADPDAAFEFAMAACGDLQDDVLCVPHLARDVCDLELVLRDLDPGSDETTLAYVPGIQAYVGVESEGCRAFTSSDDLERAAVEWSTVPVLGNNLNQVDRGFSMAAGVRPETIGAWAAIAFDAQARGGTPGIYAVTASEVVHAGARTCLETLDAPTAPMDCAWVGCRDRCVGAAQ